MKEKALSSFFIVELNVEGNIEQEWVLIKSKSIVELLPSAN